MKNKPRAFSEKGEELFFDEEGNLINKKQTMKEKEIGWVSALIKCDLCSHESLSVHHVSCDKLECGNCGHMSNFELLKNYTEEP